MEGCGTAKTYGSRVGIVLWGQRLGSGSSSNDRDITWFGVEAGKGGAGEMITLLVSYCLIEKITQSDVVQCTTNAPVDGRKLNTSKPNFFADSFACPCLQACFLAF